VGRGQSRADEKVADGRGTEGRGGWEGREAEGRRRISSFAGYLGGQLVGAGTVMEGFHTADFIPTSRGLELRKK
jgi:hypothetical protein